MNPIDLANQFNVYQNKKKKNTKFKNEKNSGINPYNKNNSLWWLNLLVLYISFLYLKKSWKWNIAKNLIIHSIHTHTLNFFKGF